jgi:DNA-binding transcriptional regulator YiaG
MTVKEFIEWSGIRSEDLAAILRISFKTVERWKRGESEPSPLAVEAIKRLIKDLKSKEEHDASI